MCKGSSDPKRRIYKKNFNFQGFYFTLSPLLALFLVNLPINIDAIAFQVLVHAVNAYQFLRAYVLPGDLMNS